MRFPSTLPPLDTPSLRLRAPDDGDVDALFALYADPRVMRYVDPVYPDRLTAVRALASMRAHLARGTAMEWVITARAGGVIVGTCCLHDLDATTCSAQIGGVLTYTAWGRGLMGEAWTALAAYAREVLGLAGLRAEVDPANARCLRLLERLGYSCSGHADSLRLTLA